VTAREASAEHENIWAVVFPWHVCLHLTHDLILLTR
jgi:hypothetical protein